MLIDRLAFKDFLVFPGEQVLRFSFEESRNLSLILAPNNSGKTTVIRALEFLLYGENDKKRQAKLPCHARLESMKPREEDEAWVEATLRNGDERLRVRRSLNFVRKEAETLDAQPIECRLEAYRQEDITDILLPTTTASHDKIANLVPRAMFDFYFFKGEELAEKLLQSDRNVEIPKHLKRVLYQQEWDRVCETLSKVEKSFTRQISVKANKSREYDELMIRRDGLHQGLLKLQSELEGTKTIAESLKHDWNQADVKITELAGQSNPNRKKELEEAKRKLKKVAAERKGLVESRKNVLGNESALLLSAGSLARARSLLVPLKDKHVLPPDISEGLLIKLMELERCICERDCPKGSEPYLALGTLREESLSENVTEELWKLYNNTDPGNRRGFWFLIREKTSRLRDFQKRDAELATEESTLGESRDELEAAIDESVEVDLRKQKVRRQELADARRQNDSKLVALAQQIQSKKQALSQADEKVLKAKADAGHVGHLAIAADASAALRKLAIRCQDNLVIAMHRELAQSVGEMYAGIVTDGSIAIVDKDTLMPSIERAGVGGLYAGGGQSQVLLLCYLIALARLRKTINESLRVRFDIAHFREQGFFMDSVFGQTQGDYKRGVAALLPEHMTQLIMLLAGQQWDSNVELGIEGKVSNAYGFELVSPREDIDEEDYLFNFQGKKISLLSRADPGKQAYTVIRELT